MSPEHEAELFSLFNKVRDRLDILDREIRELKADREIPDTDPTPKLRPGTDNVIEFPGGGS